MDPQEALQYFTDLIVQQLRAGIAPYPGLAKDLKTLSKKAGVNHNEVETGIIKETLSSTGISGTALVTWKAWVPTVKKLAEDDASISEKLLSFMPDSIHGQDSCKRLGEWIEVLEQAGAAGPVSAAWVRRAVRLAQSDWDSTDDPTAPLRRIISRNTSLVGEKFVCREIDARLLDALLAAGMVPGFDVNSLTFRRISFLGAHADDVSFAALGSYAATHPKIVDKLLFPPEEADLSLLQRFTQQLIGRFVHSGSSDATYEELKTIRSLLESLTFSDAFRRHIAVDLDGLARYAAGPRVLA